MKRFIVVWLFLFASSSHAAFTPYAYTNLTGQLIPVNKPGILNLQYMLSKIGESTPTSAPQTKSISVPTSRGSLKNLLKLKKLAGFSPLGASLLALGYLFDEAGNLVWNDPSAPVANASHTGCVNPYGSGSGYANGNSYQSEWTQICQASGGNDIDGQYASTCTTGSTWNTGTQISIGLTYDDSGAFYRWHSQCTNPAIEPIVMPGQQPVPVPDGNFDDDILPQIDWPSIGTDALGNPISTPELDSATDAVNNWYENNYTQNTSTTNNTTTTTTETGSESTTEVEWPAFCDWASIVCDLANFISEPYEAIPEEQVPFEDIPQPSGFSFNAGEGCPAPASIELMAGESMSFDYQPACDFMSMIRPFVLAISSFGAAFIVIGMRAHD